VDQVVRWTSPGALLVILALAALSMPLHEIGHWLWGVLVDGKTLILQFSKVTGVDGSTYGTPGSILAGPIASAVFVVAGVLLLLLARNVWVRFLGGTLSLVMSFSRLTVYVMSLWKGMAGNDEGLVARHLGLFDWAIALPLAVIFVAGLIVVWRRAPVTAKLNWFVFTYAAVFGATLLEFWLDSVIFA
jgi:hypothetical protein